MIPIRTSYRLTHTPWVNYGLLAVNIVLFVLGYNASTDRNLAQVNTWMLHPDAPQLSQFFSSVFLHANWGHLLGNMVFLWVFGNAVNDRFGHLGYLAFYLAGGVLAGVGYVLLSGHAPVLGASGAISAVTGAYLVLLPRTRVTVLMFLFYVIMPLEIPSLYFLMFQFVWNIIATTSGMVNPHSGGGVAYAAHSAGYIFGIAVAAGGLATRLLPRDALDLLNLIQGSHRRGKFRRMVERGYDPFSRVGPGIAGGNSRRVQAKAVEAATPDSPAARELQLRREISEATGLHNVEAAAGKYLQLLQVAPEAVLSRAQQLDVANQLMAAEQYPAAADAYERFLKHYRNYEYIADIYLMLGLLYGRYLSRYDQAEHFLQRAAESLRESRKLDLARSELQAVRRRRES